MQEKVIRTHDKLYLKENRKDNPKEYFKFIINNSKGYLDKLNKPDILDIGCATGDFLYYFDSLYPDANKFGMDVMDELLDKAKDEVEGVFFFKGNIEDEGSLIDKKFDAIFMNGVHSIFDDIEPVLNNILTMSKPGGRIYIFGIFNPIPFDVILRTRRANDVGAWETGWNIFAMETISSYLDKLKVDHKFTEFKIGIDIPENPDDPLRSWTINMDNNEKIVINGLQLIHRFYLLEITN